jgi:hypothetical protein
LQERYYKEKLEMPDAGAASTHEVVQHYIRGLHWVSDAECFKQQHCNPMADSLSCTAWKSSCLTPLQPGAQQLVCELCCGSLISVLERKQQNAVFAEPRPVALLSLASGCTATTTPFATT